MLLSLDSPTLRYTGVALQNPHRVKVSRGLTAVVGPNGSGKTTLGRIVERGWNFATNAVSSPQGRLAVRYVEFSDIHSLSGFKTDYYQQRYESGMNIEVPTVAGVMGERVAHPQWRALADRMQLGGYEQKPVNALSSGELRKLLVVNQLFDAPQLLILDNPYIGLDVEARAELDAALEALVADGRVNVMLLLANLNEIPPFASSVLPMNNLQLLPPVQPADAASLQPLFDYAVDTAALPAPRAGVECPCPADTPLVEMRDCRVGYGQATVLQHVDWRIMPGEWWLLTGRNGAGKSTLLSLVHADNPQGYCNDLSLFGRRRGSGESIWDIKRHIGYVSPEMHLYFNGGHSLGLHVVAQGLNDTVGQYKRLTPGQLDEARRWLRYFGLDALADRPFRTLSSGEQRMLLLARTLVKQPPLLILDEPLHGLDQARKRAVRLTLEAMGERSRFALIYVTHRREEAPRGISHHLSL